MTRALLFDAPGPPGPAGKQGPAGPPGPQAASGNVFKTFAGTTPFIGAIVSHVNRDVQVHTASDGEVDGIVVAFSNGLTQVVTQGFVDPLVYTLGPGKACHIGNNASGQAVRVTDPSWLPNLSMVGWCDAAGAIFVQPHIRATFEVDDFGAVGDGVTDDYASIIAAINAAGSTGGEASLDSKTYLISKTLGPLPPGLVLSGRGGDVNTGNGTIIKFAAATGDAIRICTCVNVNTPQDIVIKNIDVQLTNASNTLGAAFAMQGGAYAKISDCSARGLFAYGIVLDGAESVDIDNFRAWNSNTGTSYGLWLVEGAGRDRSLSSWTVTGSTNVVQVSRMDINGPTFGVLESGGSTHTFINCECNVAPSGAFAVISGLGSKYDNCYSEDTGSSTAHYLFNGSFNVSIENCLASSASSTPCIRLLSAVYNLNIKNNYFACGPVTGSTNLAGHHHSVNNHYTGTGRMYDGNTSCDHVMFLNLEDNVSAPRYVAGTCIKPTANWDIGLDTTSAITGRPATQVSADAGVYVFKQGWWDSLTRWRDRRTVRSGVTGFLRAGDDDGFEWGSTTSSSTATALLCPSPVDVNTSGMATITVCAQRSSDGTKTGSWVIRQRFYRTSGNVTLAGSPTSVYSDADVSLTAPTLSVDTSAQTIYATCPGIAADVIYWRARVEIDRVCA